MSSSVSGVFAKHLCLELFSVAILAQVTFGEGRVCDVPMDIGAELARLASQGLSLIEVLSTWLPKTCELSYVSIALKTVLETAVYYHYDPQGDALERNVAVALRQVDELLRHEVVLAQRWNPRAKHLRHFPQLQ